MTKLHMVPMEKTSTEEDDKQLKFVQVTSCSYGPSYKLFGLTASGEVYIFIDKSGWTKLPMTDRK